MDARRLATRPGGWYDGSMRFTACIGILAVASACGSDTANDAGDELGSSESETSSATMGSSGASETSTDESESETGEPSGPALDPEQPLACWEPLGDAAVGDVWGLSTEQLLMATTEGMARVEGDMVTHVGSGVSRAIWASDLDNGWLGQDTGLVRIVDGALEPWPDLELTVWDIAGLGPSDVWVAGLTLPDGPDAEWVLLRFDGTTWSNVDVMQTFGGSLDGYHEMVATSAGVYIGSTSPWPAHLLAWDGMAGTVTPEFEYYDYVSGLTTRDGVSPLAWTSFCDIGCATGSADELVDGAWVGAPLPTFDDWMAYASAYDAEPSGVVWSVANTLSLSDEPFERVARYKDGAWQRARAPSVDSIFAMPDGVVIGPTPYRATSACLFGE